KVYSGSCRSVFHFSQQEFLDRFRDFICVRLERKVSRVVEVNLSIWIVAFESFCTGGQEERIVLAPDREKRWLAGVKVFLKFRIQGDIARVVQEQIELNLVVPRSSQQR